MAFQINHKKLARLYEYWRARCGDRKYPLRSAIDPVDLRFCLGYLALTDIEEPFRVRYRLVGTKLEKLYGAELSGFYVDELYTPHYRQKVLAAYHQVVTSKEPLYDEPFFGFFRFKLGYHRLMLPLASSGERVDMVLIGLYPADPQLEKGDDWRSLREVREWLVEEGMGPFLSPRPPSD